MRKLSLLALLLLPAAPVQSGDGEVRLLTDETIPLYLARGRELARNQQWATMVDVLQRVVIGDPKVFTDLKPEVLNAAVYSEDGRVFYPARELCLKELAAMPPEGLRTYRNRYDARARELFDEAQQEQDLEMRMVRYAKVYDAYLVSSVGDDALEAAAGLNLELGRYYEALALYRRVVEVYPKDSDRDLPMVLAKAAYCAARIGDKEHRDVLLERLASEYPRVRIRLEGKLVAAGDLIDHAAMAVQGGAEHRRLEQEWPVAGGDPARSRVAADLPESLSRKPFWRYKLSARDPRLEANYGRWQVAVHDREPAARPAASTRASELLTPYPTVRPVLYDGIVLYKDCVELIGRRVGSGTFVPLRGRYIQPAEGMDDPAYLFPVYKVRPASESDKKLAAKAEEIHRFFEYGGNSVVASGDRVFVVENSRELVHLRADAAPRPASGNLLVSYDRFTGKTLWGWHGDLCSRAVRADADAWEEWNKDFQTHPRPSFRGPGVASGGMLYTIAFEDDSGGAVSLWAFDLKRGRVRFRTLLHHADEVTQRLPVGGSLAVAGGVVYVATSSGVLAAVDSLPPGRVRWISRYPRNYYRDKGRPRRRVRRGTGRVRSRINQGFAYNDPIVGGGKIILAPPDADEVFAFHAETGRLAWHLPKPVVGKGVAYIVGISNGILVMAGSAVTGIDVAKGELAWGPNSLITAFAYGRGFVGAKYAYVPTYRPKENRAAIYRFDIRTGAEAPPLRFDVPKLGNLLSVGGRLIAANDDEIMCFTTADAELAALDRSMQRARETSELLLERAQILIRKGSSSDEVRKAFRRALAATKGASHNRNKVRLRALGYLFGLWNKADGLDALAEARAVLEQAALEPSPLARLRPYEAQAVLLEAQALAGGGGSAQEAFDALERFLDAHAGQQVVVKGKVRSGSAAAKELRGDLSRTNPAFQRAFKSTVRKRIQAAFEAGDIKALEEIPDRYDNAPPTEESYFALVRLHEKKGDTVAAEAILRDLIERFKNHPAVAEAHLRLARILIGKGMVIEARRARDKAVSRLDEAQRVRLGDLLAQVDRQLPATGQPTVIPRLALPLKSSPLGTDDAAPVQIEGDTSKLPAGLVLLANEQAYYAYGKAGKLLWTQPNPARAGVAFGPPGDPDTTVVAAAVSAARFARAVGGDLLIGDLFGITRLDGTTGRVRWQRPRDPADAARMANKALVRVRADIALLQKSDDILRRNHLPAHAQTGGAIVSVHPLRGVEAFEIDTGELIWQDPEIRTPSIGRPRILGQLLAVGWAHPGRVRVYGMGDGRIHYEYLAKTNPATKRPGAILAPPILDPLGRLLVVFGDDTEAKTKGQLEIVSSRNGRPAYERTFEVQGRYARVLYADGRLVVFHDGGSGSENLHFIDMSRREVVTRRAADMLREGHVVQDGSRLFVFTYTLGLSDLGARLFRIDLEGEQTLDYELPPRARAYARPLLTRNHVVIAAAAGSSARLLLYDREASPDSRQPKAVFRVGPRLLLPEYEVRAGGGQARYSIPPAVAVAGKDLVFSTPFGNLRFSGPGPR